MKRLRSRIEALKQVWLSKDGLLSDVGGLWVAEFLALVIAGVQSIVVARWLGPTGFGIAALVMSYPTVLFSLRDPESQHATVKYLDEFRAQGRQQGIHASVRIGYLTDAVVAAAGVLIVVGTASWASRSVVGVPEARTLLILYSLAFAFSTPQRTSRAILATFGRFKVIAVSRSANALFRLSLVLVSVSLGHGFRGFVLATAFGLFVEGASAVAITQTVVRRECGASPIRGTFRPFSGRGREVLGFLLWTNIGVFWRTIGRHLDTPIVGYFGSPADAGYYRLARAIATLAGGVTRPLQAVVFPRLAHLWAQEERQAFWSSARRYALGVGLPLMVCGLIAIPFLPSLIQLLVGEAFAPSGLAAQFLVTGALLTMAMFWVQPVLLTLGEARRWAVVEAIVGATCLAGYVLLGYLYGFTGVAFAQLLFAGIVGNAVILLYVRSARMRTSGLDGVPRTRST